MKRYTRGVNEVRAGVEEKPFTRSNVLPESSPAFKVRRGSRVLPLDQIQLHGGNDSVGSIRWIGKLLQIAACSNNLALRVRTCCQTLVQHAKLFHLVVKRYAADTQFSSRVFYGDDDCESELTR